MFSHQPINQLTISGFTLTSTQNCHIVLKALNLVNTTLPVSVKITNMTTNNVETGFYAFFQLTSNADLEIRNSTLQRIFLYEDGSLVKVDGLYAETRIYFSRIQNNAAVKGGVFVVKNFGAVKIYDWNITSNFGVTSGISDAESNGYFEFYRAQISSNSAISAPIAQLFDIFLVPLLNKCNIFSNVAYTSSQVKSYIKSTSSWGLICWLHTNFKAYLNKYPTKLNISRSIFMFEIVFATLQMENQTTVTSQSNLVNAFVSTLTFRDFIIDKWNIYSSLIKVTGSNLNMNNILISTATQPTRYSSVIFSTSDSFVNIDALTVKNTSMTAIYLQQSTSTLNNVSISNSTSSSNIVILRSALNTTITNWSITNISQRWNKIVNIMESYVHLIKNVTINGLKTDAVNFWDSKINLIDGIYVTNVLGSWIINYDSQINLITNSEFTSNGKTSRTDTGKGFGWIYNLGGNLTITDSQFLENRSLRGAAISNICSNVNYCSITLKNISFKKGEGFVSGGAIHYDVFRPKMENITFESNIAPYGPNISSYPMKIVMKGTTNSIIVLEDVPSGQAFSDLVVLEIIDYDNQTYSLKEAGSVFLNKIDLNTYVAGDNSQGLVSGTASFLGIIFVAQPGSKNVKFKVSSNVIDSSKLLKMFGKYFCFLRSYLKIWTNILTLCL